MEHHLCFDSYGAYGCLDALLEIVARALPARKKRCGRERNPEAVFLYFRGTPLQGVVGLSKAAVMMSLEHFDPGL